MKTMMPYFVYKGYTIKPTRTGGYRIIGGGPTVHDSRAIAEAWIDNLGKLTTSQEDLNIMRKAGMTAENKPDA